MYISQLPNIIYKSISSERKKVLIVVDSRDRVLDLTKSILSIVDSKIKVLWSVDNIIGYSNESSVVITTTDKQVSGIYDEIYVFSSAKYVTDYSNFTKNLFYVDKDLTNMTQSELITLVEELECKLQIANEKLEEADKYVVLHKIRYGEFVREDSKPLEWSITSTGTSNIDMNDSIPSPNYYSYATNTSGPIVSQIPQELVDRVYSLENRVKELEEIINHREQKFKDAATRLT